MEKWRKKMMPTINCSLKVRIEINTPKKESGTYVTHFHMAPAATTTPATKSWKLQQKESTYQAKLQKLHFIKRIDCN